MKNRRIPVDGAAKLGGPDDLCGVILTSKMIYHSLQLKVVSLKYVIPYPKSRPKIVFNKHEES